MQRGKVRCGYRAVDRLQGEDWEHEEAAADDDLDMGESEEEDAPSPVRK